jgi:hypothetical protein
MPDTWCVDIGPRADRRVCVMAVNARPRTFWPPRVSECPRTTAGGAPIQDGGLPERPFVEAKVTPGLVR